MNRDMQVKHEVLEMIKQFLMGEEGKKFGPKSMSVEMVSAKPAEGKGGLSEVLKEASEHAPDMEGSPEDMEHDIAGMKRTGKSMEEWEGSPEDMEEDEMLGKSSKKKSLREFLDSRE